MARNKNALRGHFIAPYKKGEEEPKEFMELAHLISDITSTPNEEVEEEGFYDGDGTAETSVNGMKPSWDYEGIFDQEDEAQAYIHSLKYKTGDDRKVWQKVVSSDGKTEEIGVATVSEIVTGGGNAIEDEQFSCTITYNQIPETREVTPSEAG